MPKTNVLAGNSSPSSQSNKSGSSSSEEERRARALKREQYRREKKKKEEQTAANQKATTSSIPKATSTPSNSASSSDATYSQYKALRGLGYTQEEAAQSIKEQSQRKYVPQDYESYKRLRSQGYSADDIKSGNFSGSVYYENNLVMSALQDNLAPMLDEANASSAEFGRFFSGIDDISVWNTNLADKFLSSYKDKAAQIKPYLEALEAFGYMDGNEIYDSVKDLYSFYDTSAGFLEQNNKHFSDYKAYQEQAAAAEKAQQEYYQQNYMYHDEAADTYYSYDDIKAKEAELQDEKRRLNYDYQGYFAGDEITGAELSAFNRVREIDDQLSNYSKWFDQQDAKKADEDWFAANLADGQDSYQVYQDAAAKYDAASAKVDQLKAAKPVMPLQPDGTDPDYEQKMQQYRAEMQQYKRGIAEWNKQMDYAAKSKAESYAAMEQANRYSDYSISETANSGTVESLAAIKAGQSAYEKILASDAAAQETFNASMDPRVNQAGYDLVEALYADRSYKRVDTSTWDPEQQNAYYYLLGTGETERADRYAENVNNAKNAEARYKDLKQITDWQEEHPFLGTLASFGTGVVAPLASGMGEYLMSTEEYLGRGTITQKDYFTPVQLSEAMVSTTADQLNRMSGVTSEDLGPIGGKGAGDVYQLAVSVAQSLLAVTVGGEYGSLAMFFGSAASSGIYDALDRGLEPGKALALGTFNGLAEVLGEKFSVENLINGVHSDAAIKGALKAILVQAGIEGSEEGFTTLLNTAADMIINGDKNELNIAYMANLNKGMSREEASKLAATEWFNGLAYDMISGAASGGLSAGIHIGASKIAGAGTYTGMDKNGNRIGLSAEQLLDYDEQFRDYGGSKNVGKTVDSLREKLNNKGKISNYDAGRLNAQIEYYSKQQTKDEARPIVKAELTKAGLTEYQAEKVTERFLETYEDIDTKQEGWEKELIKGTGLKMSEETSKALKAGLFGMQETIARQQGRIFTDLQKKQSQRIEDAIKNKFSAELAENEQLQKDIQNTKKELGRLSNEGTITEQERREMQQKISDAEDKIASNNEKINRYTVIAGSFESVRIGGNDYLYSATRKSGDTFVVDYVNSKGEKVTMNLDDKRLPASTKAVVEDFGKQFGENLDDALSVYSMNPNMDMNEFAAAFKSAVDFGTSGVDAEKLLKHRVQMGLTREQFLAAYNVGHRAYEAEMQKTTGKNYGLTKGTVDMLDEDMDINGTMFKKISTADLPSQEQMDFIRAASRALGLRFVLYKSEIVDGQYVGANGMFRTSDGTIYVDVNAGMYKVGVGEATIGYTLSHEITHWFQESSPREYAILKKFVLENVLNDSTKDLKTLVAEKMANGYSHADALDDVVADGCEEVLTNSVLLEELIAQDQGTGKKAIAKAKEIVRKIRDLLPGSSHAEAKAQRKYMDDLVTMWDNCLKASMQAQRNGSAETTNSESVKMQAKALQEEKNKDPKSLTEQDFRQIMSYAQAGYLKFGTYVPASTNTPDLVRKCLRYIAHAYNLELDADALNAISSDYPLAIDIKKLCQALGSKNVRYGDGWGHEMTPDDIVSILNNLNSPAVMLYEGNDTNHLAFVIPYEHSENGDIEKRKAIVSFELSPQDLSRANLNGYKNGDYNITITLFRAEISERAYNYLSNRNPDAYPKEYADLDDFEKETFEINRLKNLKGNSVITIKQIEGETLQPTGSYVPSGTRFSPFNNINLTSDDGIVKKSSRDLTNQTFKEAERAMENGESVSPENELKLSIRYNDQYMERARLLNHKAKHVSDDTIAQAAEARREIAMLLGDPVLREKFGLPEDIEGNTFLSDASYGGTEENTTICPRSLAAQAFMDLISKQLGRPLTVRDTLIISQEMMNTEEKPECLYCYVATDRKAYREYLGNYLEERNKVLAALENGTDPEKAYNDFLNGRKDTDNMKHRFELFRKAAKAGALITPTDLASLDDLFKEDDQLRTEIIEYIAGKKGINTKGLQITNDALKGAKIAKSGKGKTPVAFIEDYISDPEIGEKVLRFTQLFDAEAYAQSASWAKKMMSYTAYNNHILTWGKKKIDSFNEHYGLRMYSFSDFSPAYILENMQMITDAAVKGLKVLAYTKEMEFAEIFAKTGMNINISVFATQTKDGRIIRDGMIGADWDRAIALRKKYPNVGITLVATNDDILKYGLESEDVDVVIPYHLVRTGQAVAEYFNYTNYTDVSADKKNTADYADYWEEEKAKPKNAKNPTSVYPSEHQNDLVKYVRALEKYHLTPRFASYLQGMNEFLSGKIDEQTFRAMNPNYMKLVNETRRSAGETPTVQPIFDVEAAKSAINNMGAYFQPIGGATQAARNATAKRVIRAIESIEDKNDAKLSARDNNEVYFQKRETDPAILKDLNDQVKSGDYTTTYKAFALIDGKLYPPMASYERDPITGQFLYEDYIDEKGRTKQRKVLRGSATAVSVDELNNRSNLPWIASEGKLTQELIDSKPHKNPKAWQNKYAEQLADGRNPWGYYLGDFSLDKSSGKAVPAAYNPYQHSSDMVLNDQFEEAWNRPEIVVVECRIPNSELNNPYWAPYAKDPTGKHEWKSGPIAGQFTKTSRNVYMSRWIQPVRILSFEETAQKIMDVVRTENNPDLKLYWNNFNPYVLQELEKMGAPIDNIGSPNYRRTGQPRNVQAKFSQREPAINRKAIEHFGTTEDFREAGYILTGGEMLDFSGRHWGSTDSGRRDVDHEDIYEIYNRSGDNRLRFINEGNIRFSPEAPGINLSASIEPTAAQYARIRDFLRQSDAGSFYVDFEGRRDDRLSYTGKVNADRVINDMKHYYATGSAREQSVVSQFHYSRRDSTGKELSDQQIEYFRDSKIRDADGNLLVVYHGSSSKNRNSFSYSKIGTAGGANFGYGFYFTPSKREAGFYTQGTGRVMEGYLNITNPIDGMANDLSADVMRILEALPYSTRLDIEAQYGSLEEAAKGLEKYNNATMLAILPGHIGAFPETVNYTLLKLGYDGIIAQEEGYEAEYIAFDSSQFKYADNKKPTNNEDFRFQMRDNSLTDREILLQAFEDAVTTKAQQEALRVYKKGVESYRQTVSEYREAQRRLAKAPDNIALKAVVASLEKKAAEQNKNLRAQELHNKPLGEILSADNRIAKGLIDSEYREKYNTKYAALDKEKRRLQAELNRTNKKDATAIRKLQEKIADRDKKIKDLREERDRKVSETRKRYQDMAKRNTANRRESAAAGNLRDRVWKQASTLNEWLTANSDKEHIPEALKRPIAEFLETIDFSSKRRLAGGPDTGKDVRFLNKLRRLEDVLNNQKAYQEGSETAGSVYDGYIDLDPETLQAIHTLVRQIESGTGENFTVNEMNSEQLKALNDALTAITKAVKTMNRFFANRHYQGVYEASESTIDFLQKLGPAAAITGKATDFLLWNNTNPYYAFKRFGDAGQAVFDAFAAGWDKLAMNAKQIIDFTESLYTDKEVKDWENNVRSFTMEDGSVIKITDAQIMGLYELLKREQAVQHIQGGGVRIGNIGEGVKKIVDTEHHHFTATDLAKLTGMLSPKQIEVADKLQRFMNTVGTEWGNSVSMERFGYKFFTEDNYYPIKTDENDIPKDSPDAQGNEMFRLLNMSATKGLIVHANNALVVSSIFDVFADHMSDMAKYNALALPILDAMKWYNFKSRVDNGDGTFTTRTVKKSMEKAWGNGSKNYFTTFIKDLNGVREGGRGDDWINKLFISNYKVASVGANIRVALLQPTSYVRAGAVINPKYLMKAMRMKGNIKEAIKYSGTAVWKDLGYFDTNIARNMREQIKHDDGVMDKVREASMLGAEYGDKWTWGKLWTACKLQIQDTQKPANNEDLMKKTADLFRETVYATQVMDSTMTRSHTMRNTSGLATLTTAFMSEPTLSYNMVLDAVMKYRIGMRSGMNREEAWKQNKKPIMRAFIVYAMTAAAAAAVESFVDAMRDDDDYESFADKYMEAMMGSKVFDGNLVGDLDLIQKLPVIKDVVSLASGYSNERMDTQYITNSIKAFNIWKETYQLWKGTLEEPTATTYYGKMTTWGKVFNTMKAASQIVGLPFSSLQRDIQALWNNTVGNFAEGMKLKTYAPSPKSAIEEAYANGYITSEQAQQYLMDNGVAEDEDAAYFMVKSFDGEGKFDAVVDAAMAGDTEAYEAGMDDLEEHGVREKDVFSKVKSEIKLGYLPEEGKEQTISKDEAVSRLVKYADMSKEDAKALVNEWTCELVTGIPYSSIKDEYLDGKITADRAESLLVKYGGKTKEDAADAVDKYRMEKEYGIAYSDLKDAVIRGKITPEKAMSALMKYGGKTEEEADKAVTYYQFLKENPNSLLSDSKAVAYMRNIKPLGIPLKDFEGLITMADTDGNGSYTQNETGTYIADMGYTGEKAEALWNAITGGNTKTTYDLWTVKYGADSAGNNNNSVSQAELGPYLVNLIQSGKLSTVGAQSYWESLLPTTKTTFAKWCSKNHIRIG